MTSASTLCGVALTGLPPALERLFIACSRMLGQGIVACHCSTQKTCASPNEGRLEQPSAIRHQLRLRAVVKGTDCVERRVRLQAALLAHLSPLIAKKATR